MEMRKMWFEKMKKPFFMGGILLLFVGVFATGCKGGNLFGSSESTMVDKNMDNTINKTNALKNKTVSNIIKMDIPKDYKNDGTDDRGDASAQTITMERKKEDVTLTCQITQYPIYDNEENYETYKDTVLSQPLSFEVQSRMGETVQINGDNVDTHILSDIGYDEVPVKDSTILTQFIRGNLNYYISISSNRTLKDEEIDEFYQIIKSIKFLK